MRMLFALFVGLLALPAGAEIYRYTDANGNTVFTNQPPDGVNSQEVKLPPANTVQSPPADAYPTSDSENPSRQATYGQLAITNLPDAEAIRANNGSFTVDIAIDPQLAPGHQLQLLLDGQPYGSPGTSTRFQVLNADRGEHSLAVAVLDARGAVLQQSDALAFTVQRVNLNSSPALRPKPAAPAPAPRAP